MPCYRIHYITTSTDGNDALPQSRIFEVAEADEVTLGRQIGVGDMYLDAENDIVYTCEVLPQDAVGHMHTLLPNKLVYVISAVLVE